MASVREVAATAAGILLFRRRGESIELLLVHPGGPFWAKKDEGVWSIPKGSSTRERSERACALRELEEELGSALGLTGER